MIVAHFRFGPLDGAVLTLEGRPGHYEVFPPPVVSAVNQGDSPLVPEPPRVTYRRGPRIAVTDKAAFAMRWPISGDHFWFIADDD